MHSVSMMVDKLLGGNLKNQQFYKNFFIFCVFGGMLS